MPSLCPNVLESAIKFATRKNLVMFFYLVLKAETAMHESCNFIQLFSLLSLHLSNIALLCVQKKTLLRTLKIHRNKRIKGT